LYRYSIILVPPADNTNTHRKFPPGDPTEEEDKDKEE
jgi:hypothetical protein